MKFNSLVFLLILIFAKQGISKDLLLYIEPAGDINYTYFRFPGLLDFGIKNVNKETIYPEADFSPYFSPGVFFKAKYGNLSIRTGFMFGNYLYSLSPDKFPLGFAYQYDGDGKYRYFLGDYFVPRDEKIMFNIDKTDLYIGLNLNIFNNASIGFLYENIQNDISRAAKHPISGVAIDTVGSYVNHQHITNSYYITLLYTYPTNIVNIHLKADLAPYILYKIDYNHNNERKKYDGYAYKLGAGISWKGLFLNYYYSVYQTKSDLFYNQAHTIRLGFSWEALKIDIGEIDLFH